MHRNWCKTKGSEIRVQGGEVEGPREQGNEGPERLVGELVLSLVPKR